MIVGAMGPLVHADLDGVVLDLEHELAPVLAAKDREAWTLDHGVALHFAGVPVGAMNEQLERDAAALLATQRERAIALGFALERALPRWTHRSLRFRFGGHRDLGTRGFWRDHRAHGGFSRCGGLAGRRHEHGNSNDRTGG
jgi:hypothetical protein